MWSFLLNSCILYWNVTSFFFQRILSSFSLRESFLSSAIFAFISFVTAASRFTATLKKSVWYVIIQDFKSLLFKREQGMELLATYLCLSRCLVFLYANAMSHVDARITATKINAEEAGSMLCTLQYSHTGIELTISAFP